MTSVMKRSSLIAISLAAATIVSTAQATAGKTTRASATVQRASVLSRLAGTTQSIPRPPGITTHGRGQSVRTFLRHRRQFDGYGGLPGTAGLAVCDHYQNVIKTYLPGGNNGWGYVAPLPPGWASSQRIIVRATSNLPNGAGGWRPDSYVDWSSSSSPGSWGFNAWWLGNQAFPYQAYVPMPLRGWNTAIVVYEFWWIDLNNPNRWLYDRDLRQCQQWL